MPKKEIDYSKTVIYKIVCNDLSIKDLYVGSTTDFRNRKNHHKTACNNPQSKDYNMKVYEFIRNNGNWENWTMVEIEKYPCNDGNEARSRERYFVEKLKASLNGNLPQRSKSEYYEDNKSKILQQRKLTYENKGVEIKQKKAIPEKCGCGSVYRSGERARHIRSNKHQRYEKQKKELNIINQIHNNLLIIKSFKW